MLKIDFETWEKVGFNHDKNITVMCLDAIER